MSTYKQESVESVQIKCWMCITIQSQYVQVQFKHNPMYISEYLFSSDNLFLNKSMQF